MKQMTEEMKEKTNSLFYGFMKEARRNSFMEFLEGWEITYEEYEKIQEWFKGKGLKLG